MTRPLLTIILLAGSVGGAVHGADFQAGVARMVITPQSPIWLSGFASRNHVSEGVAQDLWAKALVFDDGRGGRVVMVTMDLIGLPREISDEVASRVLPKHGLKRSQLILLASHTHSGPLVYPNLAIIFDGNDEERQVCERYARKLVDDLVSVVDAAFADLAPAKISTGHGSAGFSVNRRALTPEGRWAGFGENPDGPVDYDVPVIRIAAPDGKVRAVVFGYACHCVVMGSRSYTINGDYAGFAQFELEKALPDATAMFVQLCAGDQNPRRRESTLENAATYGKELADAVQKSLDGKLRPVHAPIRTTYESISLDFAPYSRVGFEEEFKEGKVYERRRAERMLATYDGGGPPRQLSYPIQVVRWGSDLTLIALGGEVVVDYALCLKREFPQEDLIVAAYANDVMCYIPTVRILREGGYEAEGNMTIYGQPGPLAETVEKTMLDACRKLLRETARTSP